MLRSLPEGVMRDEEDARVVFVRGLYYRKSTLEEMLGAGGPFDFTLAAEPENEADPNAVSVMLNGSKIGYIPRELAPEYQQRVQAGTCRIAARGEIETSGDSFTLVILVAWAR
jgi:hypothetical protein